MKLLEKIKTCIALKMVARSVPKMIADKVAHNYVHNDMTETEHTEIHNGRMVLEYSNTKLAIEKVNVGKLTNNARLMSLSTASLSIL